MKSKPGKKFGLKRSIFWINSVPGLIMLKTCPGRFVCGLEPADCLFPSTRALEVGDHWLKFKLV
jgi:hypothetical protein